MIVEHPFFHGETPSHLPVTCLEGIPHWKNLTPSISRRNFRRLAVAAGIGPGSIDRDVGGPVTVKDVIQTTAPAIVEKNNLGQILPECLSPKVSATNLRGVVVSTAQEQLSKTSMRSTRSAKPLSDLPINKANTGLPTQFPVLGRARRMGEGEVPVSKKVAVAPPTSAYVISPQRKNPTFETTEPINQLRETLENVKRTLASKQSHDMYMETSGNQVYISQWVDYSNKYGMGYQLSDGCSGVYFNDGTTIVLTPDVTYFEYIVESHNPKAPRERHQYTISDGISSTLKKKLYLMKHFREYMLTNLYVAEQGVQKFSPDGQVSFLTDYLRTKHATMFRLSSGEIQFNFTDHYKMVLTDGGRTVRFMDPSRNAVAMSVAQLIHRARRTKGHQEQKAQLGAGSGEQILERMEFIAATLQGWHDRTTKATRAA